MMATLMTRLAVWFLELLMPAGGTLWDSRT